MGTCGLETLLWTQTQINVLFSMLIASSLTTNLGISKSAPRGRTLMLLIPSAPGGHILTGSKELVDHTSPGTQNNILMSPPSEDHDDRNAVYAM